MSDDAMVRLIAALLVAFAAMLMVTRPHQAAEPHDVTTPTAAPAVVYDP